MHGSAGYQDWQSTSVGGQTSQKLVSWKVTPVAFHHKASQEDEGVLLLRPIHSQHEFRFLMGLLLDRNGVTHCETHFQMHRAKEQVSNKKQAHATVLKELSILLTTFGCDMQVCLCVLPLVN